MLQFWWRPLLLLGGLAVASALLARGAEEDTGWFLFALGLLAYLLHHLRQLYRLDRWLAARDRPPLASGGLWGDTLYRLEKMLRVRQADQQRTAADLEQMLEATRHLPDGVVILDQENRITWLNQAAQTLLGLSPTRDPGQYVLYLLRQSNFANWLQHEDYAKILQFASPVMPEKTLAMQLVPLPRAQKMLLARDITELARVEAMRRDFVANVSHELRTPITVIVGFLEAFDDMPAPDPVEFRRHIPLMREQTDRIRRLVDDLLTLARLESEPDTKDETVDVAALARRLAEECETMSGTRHQVSLHVDSSARLIGNSQELYSAFANLVSNAVRYTPAGGRIGIHWRREGPGEMVFAVTDTGEGIEPQHIPRLTERFYRVDRGRSRATGGTGLGLAIVKHVLQRHQARLRVDSTLGKGSTFAAVFPAERVIPLVTPDAGAAAPRNAS